MTEKGSKWNLLLWTQCLLVHFKRDKNERLWRQLVIPVTGHRHLVPHSPAPNVAVFGTTAPVHFI